MRLSTLPALVIATALLLGAAAEYPGAGGAALGAAGFVFLGAWLTLEIGSEVAERWRRVRAPKEEETHSDRA